MTSIALRDVRVDYDGLVAVDGLSLDVPRGSWVTLIGPNGAGKTTLLRAIAGLVPHSGSIHLGDRSVADLRRRDLARAVAFVPQLPFAPRSMRVLDYVLMGRTPYVSYFGMESAHDLGIAASVLERMELGTFVDRPLGEMSGGEFQRVVLARALAQEASVLLLDEPTSSLDVGHQQQVLELVDSMRVSEGLTVVSAMHDLTLAAQFADTLVMLAGGRPVSIGTARSVLTEGAISQHYGASVQVVESVDGGILVIPIRTRPRSGNEEAVT